MATKVPSTLKLSKLKLIANKCGIWSSGTKPILSQRLANEISLNGNHGSTRVLTIDMGIRNLAYCVLHMPSKSLKKANNVDSSKRSELPSIIDWQRLAVSSPPPKTSPPTKEAFDPATIAAVAYKLVRECFLTHHPSIVLIERQRFRSMGSKHILEWTVRVNMLESMLYAVLRTLKEEGKWDGEVVAIAPGKVGPFWVGEDNPGDHSAGEAATHKKKSISQSTKTRNKGFKMDLVRKWLQTGEMFVLGNAEVENTAAAYMKKWERAPGRLKGKRRIDQGREIVGEEMGKLDDLADCLLQGMAWREWEQNKEIARRYGVEYLIGRAESNSAAAKTMSRNKPT